MWWLLAPNITIQIHWYENNMWRDVSQAVSNEIYKRMLLHITRYTYTRLHTRMSGCVGIKVCHRSGYELASYHVTSHQHSIAWYDMIWHDMTWYDMIWHDMTWHDMTWHEKIWHHSIIEWYHVVTTAVDVDLSCDCRRWFSASSVLQRDKLYTSYVSHASQHHNITTSTPHHTSFKYHWNMT